MQYRIEDGLIVSGNNECPQLAGYIMRFDGHGDYEPNTGKITGLELTREQIDAHNGTLAEMELRAMVEHGKGILYLSKLANGSYKVSGWTGKPVIVPSRVKLSWHNMAGKDGRTDVWFEYGGKHWHGVNVGDGQVLRVKALKGR